MLGAQAAHGGHSDRRYRSGSGGAPEEGTFLWIRCGLVLRVDTSARVAPGNERTIPRNYYLLKYLF
jgi:hypothetical protein